MIGKASEIKVKQMYSRSINNPNYDRNGEDQRRYLEIPLDDDINEFLTSIGNAEVISIQYQMSIHENVCDSVLIIYKEGESS